MPFSGLSSKEFHIFLSRNPLHHSAQVIPPKKIDNCIKDIFQKFKVFNQFFDHAENAVSRDYININKSQV